MVYGISLRLRYTIISWIFINFIFFVFVQKLCSLRKFWLHCKKVHQIYYLITLASSLACKSWGEYVHINTPAPTQQLYRQLSPTPCLQAGLFSAPEVEKDLLQGLSSWFQLCTVQGDHQRLFSKRSHFFERTLSLKTGQLQHFFQNSFRWAPPLAVLN